MTDMSKFRDLYCAEADECLGRIEQALLSLEANLSERSFVQEIFRNIHTLKGNSATMGYESVTELAHGMETRLHPLAEGSRAATSAMVSAILVCVDGLKALVKEVREEIPQGVSVLGLLDGLARAMAVGGEGAPASAPAAAAPPAAVPPADSPEVAAPSAAPAAPEHPPTSAAHAAAPAPATVRVSLKQLDDIMNLVEELTIVRSRMIQESRDASGGLRDEVKNVERLVNQLQQKTLETRMVPVSEIFGRYHRVVRDTAHSLGKAVDFQVDDRGISVDRLLLDKINEPLVHMLRNAVDHALETPEERARVGKSSEGHIILNARGEQGYAVIEVIDDGRGIDAVKIRRKAVEKGIVSEEEARALNDSQALRLICAPGFSTAAKVTEVSGRGVGMDVVQNVIDSVNGRLEISTHLGEGTQISLYLPLNLAIMQALIVDVRGEVLVIPLSDVLELVALGDVSPRLVDKQPMFLLRGELIPLYDLARHLYDDESAKETSGYGLVVNSPMGKVALHVRDLIGRQEIVVKNLKGVLRQARGVSNCTILGDGRVALILDLRGLK